MLGKLLVSTFGLLFIIYHVHAVDSALINPSNAQIVKILVTANQGEVDLAKLAKTNAENAEIKSFAEKVLKNYNLNIKQTVEIAMKNNISPEDNLKSNEIKQESAQDKDMLKDLKGRNFDLTYINNQVTVHQKILQTLETLLIPSAKNKNLLEHLNKTKDKVGEHLDQAVKLQTRLAAEIAK